MNMNITEPPLIQAGLAVSWLGAYIEDVESVSSMPHGIEQGLGVLVTAINESGPAHAIGLQPGDIIVEFDDVVIERSASLPTDVSADKFGDRVPLVVVRDDKPVVLGLDLSEPDRETGPATTMSSWKRC